MDSRFYVLLNFATGRASCKVFDLNGKLKVTVNYIQIMLALLLSVIVMVVFFLFFSLHLYS